MILKEKMRTFSWDYLSSENKFADLNISTTAASTGTDIAVAAGD